MVLDMLINRIGKIIGDIDQKTVIPFIYIAIILIGFDIITTAIGLKLGIEETYTITLIIMERFGNLYGLIISMIGKSILVISPLLAYRFVEKELKIHFLKNTYTTLYLMVIFVTIISALYIDTNNIIEINNRLQYQDYIRGLDGK